jgi:mono/diheme cytochrome c family protein
MASQPSSQPNHSDPYKVPSIAVGVLFVVTLPVLIWAIISYLPSDTSQAGAAELTSADSQAVVSVGEFVYQNSCASCHGPDGNGIAKNGKPVRNSAFVQNSSDEALFEHLVNGRAETDPANTTGVAMPARGDKNLNDNQIRSVIEYLRTLQDPSQPTASTDDWVVDLSAQAQGESTGPLVGQKQFVAYCSSCHGAAGEGMEGLGKPLITSTFAASKTDKELMNFIKTGRPMWDPENTTGVDMPPKGGNPALSDEEITQIIAFIRAIDKEQRP